jgi:hypothetical protein
MRFVLIGFALLIGLAASAALVLRSFDSMPAAPVAEQAAPPAESTPAPAALQAEATAARSQPATAAARIEPEPAAKLELPVAAQLPLVQRPQPVPQQPPVAALAPAPQSAKPNLAPGTPLRLTEEQRGRLREVLLAHNVMQAEAPATALRVGGTVPEDIVLSPLPIEIADAVPAYSRYSYLIAQDRIAIVRNERREIEALIPF